MAKINKNISQAVERDLAKRKILKLTIGGDEYEVRIKYVLSHKDKVAIIEKMSEYMMSKEDSINHGLTAFTIAAYENITDIDFGEELQDKVEMIGLLASGDYLDKITDAIPSKLMEDLMDFMKHTAEILPEFVKNAELQRIENSATEK